MSAKHIEYLADSSGAPSTSGRDLIAAGWTRPGWYFWDETGAHCHGPFKAEQAASDGMTAYAKQLDSPPVTEGGRS